MAALHMLPLHCFFSAHWRGMPAAVRQCWSFSCTRCSRAGCLILFVCWLHADEHLPDCAQQSGDGGRQVLPEGPLSALLPLLQVGVGAAVHLRCKSQSMICSCSSAV
jgi:hypothetical protein